MQEIGTRRDAWIDAALWAAAAGALGAALAVAAARFSPALDLIAQGAGPAFALVLPGAALALVLRRWRPFQGMALGLAALALALQGQWFARPPAAASGAPPARIYVSNIWRGNAQFAKTARSIAEARPDVLAIAEFSDLQAKAPGLLEGYPYRTSARPDCRYNYCPRELIASRWPIDPLPGFDRGSYGVAAARIHAPSGSFRLVLVHLTRPWPFKRAGSLRHQLADLASVLNADRSEPLVLVGDFNATLAGAHLKKLVSETGLSPAPARLGDWPSPVPAPLRIAIENAFAGDGETIASRRLGAANGSDHLPIVIEAARAAPVRSR
jgi:endonuclease/exonuclease/phosphatase (EEP) superfamily protein YafD